MVLKSLLGMLIFSMTLSHSGACPDSCFCMDAFVTCSDFTFLDMTKLPKETDTLVLTRGEMEEIPRDFLAGAKKIKILEMSNVNAKVIRSGAFTDLRELDLFSMTSSVIDVVESESFSGLTDISKFHISDSKFGTFNKRAFSNVNNVVDLRIFSSTFDLISDETFYKLSEIISFHIFQNNITSLGSKIFLGSTDIDEITIYKNKIVRISDDSFLNINDVASRVVLHANIFICSCDIVWLLANPDFNEYLASNDCIFPDHTGKEISIFRMADVTKEALCPGISSEDVTDATATEIVYATDGIVDSSLATDDDVDFTEEDLIISTVSPRFRPSSSLAPGTSAASTETSTYLPTVKATTSASTVTPTSTRSPITTSITETPNQSSSTPVAIAVSTDNQVPDDTDYPEHLTDNSHTHAQTRVSSTSTEKTPDMLKEVTQEGWTAPIPQASIDVDKGEHARSYNASAIDMTTSVPDNASIACRGTLLFIAVLSGLSWFLVTFH